MEDSQNRIVNWIENAKKHPAIVIMVSIGAILTFIITITGQINNIYEWYNDSYTYNTEYEKLEKMSLGLSFDKVKEIFGMPASNRKLCRGDIIICPDNIKEKFSISFYEHKAYYLRVIYKDQQAVFYSVTSKENDFKPKVVRIFSDETKRLGEAAYSDFLPPDYGPDKFNIFIGTSRVAYWETVEFGKPGNYKAYYFGDGPGAGYEFSLDSASELQEMVMNNAKDEDIRKILNDFRSKSQPNTYGFFESDGVGCINDFSELMNIDDMFLWRALPLYEGVDDLY